MPWNYPGSTPGIDPSSQGAIPMQFKQKKNFVTDERTHKWTHAYMSGSPEKNLSDLSAEPFCTESFPISFSLKKVLKGFMKTFRTFMT